jgi:hypothetical protein
MHRQRKWLVGAILLSVVGLVQARSAWGQSAGNGSVPSVGLGSRVDPYAGGLPPATPGYVPRTQGASTANQNMMSQSMLLDPLASGYVYGASVPMTRTQAGLYMLSMQQRMLGIGNGQLSGVRPGPLVDTQSARNRGNTTGPHASAAHTRNMNVPGGQAARYFNRGGMPAVRSQPYYQRQTRYFPQTTQ